MPPLLVTNRVNSIRRIIEYLVGRTVEGGGRVRWLALDPLDGRCQRDGNWE